jgi:O-acetyl-ADP-ribose deacetylase (regulator of RNase III)
VITTGGCLPARYVVHTVGPVWYGGRSGEAEALRNCYLSALSVAAEQGCSSVAFPAISTGVYGYPREQAAEVASQAIRDFLEQDERISKVHLVFFSSDDAQVFLAHQVFHG